MKVIIAGSRGITDYLRVKEAVTFSGFHVSSVVSGAAKGVDKLGELWAEEHNVPCIKMPADWDTHGRSAGYKRNQDMADVADACVVVYDGVSKGSKHMIDIFEKTDKPLFVYYVSQTK